MGLRVKNGFWAMGEMRRFDIRLSGVVVFGEIVVAPGPRKLLGALATVAPALGGTEV